MAVQRKRQLQLPLSPTRNYSTVLSLTHTHTNKWIRTHTYSFNSSQPYTHIPADNLKAHANTNQISHVHTLSFSSLLSTRTHARFENLSASLKHPSVLCVFSSISYSTAGTQRLIWTSLALNHSEVNSYFSPLVYVALPFPFVHLFEGIRCVNWACPKSSLLKRPA